MKTELVARILMTLKDYQSDLSGPKIYKDNLAQIINEVKETLEKKGEK